ncbi:MAG TPA: DoxX family protein [Cytophagales bacterium]|jgi:uncharacterized membrane protein YphA (DoxX/SURF4 family)|nr:DoxX family protein [Cytophagales bacterium]
MRWIKTILRFIVGVLFIFSGTIKLIDPKGFGIKLEEYFEVFATDFASFFHELTPAALYIAIFVCVLEVLLGVALLIKFHIKFTSWVLVLLILFFTGLTFYSAYFNKVTDCGCFGDAIPLTPWQSFYKDLILLFLIMMIFYFRRDFKPAFGRKMRWFIMSIALIVSIWIPVNALNHLPLIDFRPYKVGANIPEQMEPSEPFRYTYIMTKNGEEFEFENYPADTTYKFVEMILQNPEAQPKITDYSIWNDEGDFTEASFDGNKLFVIFHDVNKTSINSLGRIKIFLSSLGNAHLEIWLITSNDEQTFENFRHEYQLAYPYFFADNTVLKAMIRSNPGIMLLQEGTVKGKWHHNDTPGKGQIINLLNNGSS